nr:serine/threonine protein kinase [Planctomycetota bacterium]
TLDSVRRMAVVLRDCPAAQAGRPLERETLDARMRDALPRREAPPAPAPMRIPSPEPAASAKSDPALRIVHGYKVLQKLGRGAMATVYRAMQVSLQREVALKVLDQDVGDESSYAERFLREARAAARLNHPNVVACYDVGSSGGRLYIALELVTGGDAEAMAKRHGGVLPEAKALAVVRDCARGLCAIHAAGLVHRDIKPPNLLVAADGTVKLADFGLVRLTGADQVTQTRSAIGTPAFMSPEQALGERDVDIRSDIYSLGATLYALLAGQAPYLGSNVYKVIQDVVTAPLPDVRERNPSVSDATAAVIARAMTKNRDRRCPTPEDLLSELETAIRTLAERPAGGVGSDTYAPDTEVAYAKVTLPLEPSAQEAAPTPPRVAPVDRPPGASPSRGSPLIRPKQGGLSMVEAATLGNAWSQPARPGGLWCAASTGGEWLLVRDQLERANDPDAMTTASTAGCDDLAIALIQDGGKVRAGATGRAAVVLLSPSAPAPLRVLGNETVELGPGETLVLLAGVAQPLVSYGALLATSHQLLTALRPLVDGEAVRAMVALRKDG